MSQPDQPSASPSPPPPPPLGDWREQRRRERHLRRAARRAEWGGWAGPPLGGLILIILGGALLLQNVGYQLPERWWALLLLVPAVASLVAALRNYRERGGAPDTIAELVGGAIFTLLALALFFGLDWGVFWPVVLILIGAGVLVRGYWPR
ncbi:MAG: hypothetical protein P4M09_24790 [Devosia sp.]|nr:hypothetical protein [Devosia sp.]